MDVRDARARLIVAPLPAAGETVVVAGAEAAHARARRLASGDLVLLLDGSGRAASASVVRMGRDGVHLAVGEILDRAPTSSRRDLLVAGLRPERLTWLVEKATELGASRIAIVASERTQAFRASASAVARLERVAQEAAKQSGRLDWPVIGGTVSLMSALESETAEHRFFLDGDGGPFPSRLREANAAILVGPEGGWTPLERDAAAARGWNVVRLPAGKLRAETATIAALLLLLAATERGNP
jgi:16S rRNA (uracil1498-N3)-methyltransferase